MKILVKLRTHQEKILKHITETEAIKCKVTLLGFASNSSKFKYMQLELSEEWTKEKIIVENTPNPFMLLADMATNTKEA